MIAAGGGGEVRATGLTDEFRAAIEGLEDELNRLRGLLHVAAMLGHQIEDASAAGESLLIVLELAERARLDAATARARIWNSQGGQVGEKRQ